jgi:hypothetical protein
MATGFEAAQQLIQNPELAAGHPETLAPLMTHLADSVRTKAARLEAQGKTIDVLTPDWSRANPTEAGQMHADVIIGTYGSTYALPNKDPKANREAIESGGLDVYFMTVDNQVTGTACLVNTGDGRAELGRSASIGRSGNTIIQDIRILDWLANPDTADKYHTLFTTLRSAPDRVIDDSTGYFVMRGGQAITEHWRKFPSLMVNGFAPLYLKHGKLEQFTYASLTRSSLEPTRPLYLADVESAKLIGSWHDHYQLPHPRGSGPTDPDGASLGFEAHYPPAESGLTSLVHADVVASSNGSSRPLAECLAEVGDAGSPFTQIVMPIDRDTRNMQAALLENGYKVFGYQPASENTSAALMYGRVTPGIEVVPTHWSENQAPNPFWSHDHLHAVAESAAGHWHGNA